MSKGSKRRPTQVDEENFRLRWEQAFGKSQHKPGQAEVCVKAMQGPQETKEQRA